jgi:poly(3-hydroxybutyrate) depolymerase
MADSTPMPEQDWHSTAGTVMRASVTSLSGNVATLKKADGTVIKVPLDKLAEADRKLITTHFSPAPAAAKPTASAAPLPWKQGEITGPIEAKGGSHFFIYLPESLRPGTKLPLLFITHASGGRAEIVKRAKEGADVAQWAVAACVESKNGATFQGNTEHAMNCLATLQEKLPLDTERVYFQGESGGGRMALANAQQFKVAGIIPIIAGFTNGPNPNVPCFWIDGAKDYNRYEVAAALKAAGKDSTLRYNPGGHTGGPDALITEGILWHQCNWLKKHRAKEATEAAALDASILAYLETNKTKQPGATLVMVNTLIASAPTGSSATTAASLKTALEAVPANKKYADAIYALEEFAKKEWSGISKGSSYSHNDPGASKAAERLATKYADVPEIAEICKALAQPTVGK